MTAAAVGVKPNLKLVNLMAGEHMKPDYLKVSLNLLHFPTPNVTNIIEPKKSSNRDSFAA